MLVKRLLSMQKSSFWPKMLLVAFLAFLIFTFALPHLALAQTQDFGLQSVSDWGIFGQANIFVFIGRLIQVFFGLLGVVAVIIIMYAGFSLMLSQGDPAKIAKAKKIITNAIIGLIIIFMAFALVTFVISMLQRVGSYGGGPGRYPGSPFDPYRSAIGRGPIESVYPAPNATNIPINTWIAVTFKEPIDWDSVHDTTTFGILIKNIEICQISATSSSCLPSSTPAITAADLASSTIVRTDDNKTIVISTNRYLGNEDGQTRTFKVLLKKDIKSLATGRSIFGTDFGYYEWAFKTNGQLDLDPPEIVSTDLNMLGVYPLPDNQRDAYPGASEAVKASNTITFTSIPATNSPTLINGVAFNKNGASAELVSSTGGIPEGFKAMIMTGSGYDFSSSTGDKAVTTTITSADVATFSGDFAALGLNSTSSVVGYSINTKIGLTIDGSGPFPVGSGWRFTVKPSQLGDNLTINTNGSIYRFVFVGNDNEQQNIVVIQNVGGATENIIYKTVKTGDTTSTAAANLANAINASQAQDEVTALAVGGEVILSAATAGSNNTSYVYANSASTVTRSLTGGVEAQFGRDPKGNQDAYNNTIFQMNFNEAINPAFISNIKVYNGVNLVDDATVTVSNQYRTIEIKGPNECGVNACGDKMYCWLDSVAYPTSIPTSTPFKVKIEAASLKTCTSTGNSWCTGSFGGSCEVTGGGRCSTSTGAATVYFPQANITNVNGIIDMSGNSFNGSFNTTTIFGKNGIGMAEGKSNTDTADGGSGSSKAPYIKDTSTYPVASNTAGDDFAWTFYVSNEIDNHSPLLGTIDPTGEYNYGYASTEDFSRPVWLAFDRIMSFSSLKPGWGYDGVKYSKAWHNRFLALTTMTKGANPVGFWIGNNNIDKEGDHIADYTQAGIEHNRFDRSVRYSPLAGSGIMSITQNCFLPSKGPANAGNVTCGYVTSTGEPNSDCSSSTLPNPASYAKLKCTEIDGAKPCSSTSPYNKKCNPLYDSNRNSTTSGSWVIADDYQTIYSDSSTGCCLGTCVDKP